MRGKESGGRKPETGRGGKSRRFAALPRLWTLGLGLWTLAVLLLAFPCAALAQDDPMEEEKYRTGLVPTHTYSSLAGLGSVDLYTGGFTVAIPLLTLPGRAGHDLSLALTYNSKQIVRYPYQTSSHAVRFYDEGPTVGRWKLNYWPQLQQEGSVYYFTSPDGAVHRIAWNPTHGTYVSDDSTNIRVSGYGKVEYLSGEKFDFSAFASQLQVYHLDSNGNRITYEFEEIPTFPFGSVIRPLRIIDTLGRTVELAYTSSTGTDLSSLTVKNHAGADLTWSFSYTVLEIRMQEESSYDVQYEFLYEYPTLLSGLTLPDGRSYQMEYDHVIYTDGQTYYFDLGTRCQLTSLTLPTGAGYSFEYGVPSGLSQDAGKDATASQYLESVSVDPVGGGAFSTDYSYVRSAYYPDYLEKTIEYRADGSKLEADWNAWGTNLGLRDRQRIYDTDGYTEMQETFTTWGATASGKTVTKSKVKESPSGTWSYVERTTDIYGREVLSWSHDYSRSNASGSGPQYAFRTAGARRWFSLDTTLWQSRLLRQDSLRWEGGQEVVTASSEFLYDQYPLTDRGTVTGRAPGYGVSTTNRGNLTTTRVYDALNDRFLESEVHFDTLGNPVKQVDVLDRQTLIGYSASHHYAYPTQVTNPLGHTAQTAYNFNTGLPTSWTDANGQLTSQTYETYNRPLKRTFPDGGWADWTYYDQFNSGKYRTRVRTRRLLNGSQQSIRNEYFDGLGRLARTLDYEGNSVWTYVLREYALCGCSGRTSKVSMPYRPGDPIYWTTTEYDGLGRPRKLIPPDGSPSLNFTEYRYGFTTETSAPRRLIKATFDAKGVGILHLYDADGVLRRTGEDAVYATLSSNTWTDYDEYPGSLRQKSVQWEGQSLTLNFAKHMFRQTVQGVQARTFQHDALGRLVWEEHPEFYHQGVQYGVSYLYDDAGRITQKTDPRGIVTTTTYDNLDRTLSMTYSDATPAVSYTYDQGLYGIGRLSSASNSVASTGYTYDKMGRTLQQDKTIGGSSFSMSWTYNAGGLVTSYTLPNGTTISQSNDTMGRPTSITSDWVDANHPATLATSFSYHPTGALVSVDYGNGTTSTRSYTSGGLLKTLQHGTAADPGGLLDFEYDYQEGIANNARIVGITDHNDASKSQTYSYDGFQRLLTAETAGSHWGLSWSYDRYGNRLSQTVTKGTAPSQSLNINAQSNRVTGWTYDQAGNTLNDGTHAYAYDANSNMISLDGGSTVYTYDAGGNRVQKVTVGQTISYFFGVGEHLSGQGWSRLYIKMDGEKLIEYSGGTTHFFHVDHRFTPRVRTDLSGSPDQTWDDLPFGEEWQSTGGGYDTHRLTGHLRDAESNLEYAGARHYSSQKGRWLAVDPVKVEPDQPQGMNRFSYVLNDPMNHLDAVGREWTFIPFVQCVTVSTGPESGDVQVCVEQYVAVWQEGTRQPQRPAVPTRAGTDEFQRKIDSLDKGIESAQSLLENEPCLEFIGKIFKYGIGIGVPEEYMNVDHLRERIHRALYDINGQTYIDQNVANTPGFNTIAATSGRTVYLSEAFFHQGRNARGATVIHEAFHLGFSSFGFTSIRLSDEELAAAAGVFEDGWNSLSERERQSRSSSAFSKELREHCH